MGFFDRFRTKSPRDQFAEMLLDRLKQGGETREVTYEPEAFTLRRVEDDQVFYLGNAYAEYERANTEDRENVIRVFLSTWFTSHFELPKSLDDAKSDLLVTVRDRSYFEVDIPLCADNQPLAGGLVYCELAECLAVAPVYDMPTSIRSLSDDDLAAWDVTLYEVIEIAKQNLKEMTRECAQVGPLYLFASGDSHDAARLLLTDVIGSLELEGAPIAMVPNRELLVVTGEDSDEGLDAMLSVVEPALEHERRISGCAFRLQDDGWSPWLPAAEHPLRQRFAILRVKGQISDHERQKELLEKQLEQQGRAAYVAGFNAVQGDDGVIRTYTTWTQGVPTLLPRTDYVVFMATDEGGMPSHIAAAADWNRVEQQVGDLLTRQVDYPPRYETHDFPSTATLEQLGIAEWARS